MHKVGDRVIITHNHCMHGFPIGSTVVVSSFERKIGERSSYKGYLVDGPTDTWYFSDDDCRSVVVSNKDVVSMLDDNY